MDKKYNIVYLDSPSIQTVRKLGHQPLIDLMSKDELERVIVDFVNHGLTVQLNGTTLWVASTNLYC